MKRSKIKIPVNNCLRKECTLAILFHNSLFKTYNFNAPMINMEILCIWQLILANPGSIVMEKLLSSKLNEHIGSNNIFLTVADAVRFCTRKSMQEP